MALTWYEKIRSIKAHDGFVFIYTDEGAVQMTVDEAVERADAIRNMLQEVNSRELAEVMMKGALEAQLQKNEMLKEGTAFDYTTEAVLRRLERKGQQKMLRKTS